MTPLVKHYLLRARPKIALLVSLSAVVLNLGSWILHPSGTPQAWLPTFMMVAMYATGIVVLGAEAGEFELILPVRRRTLYLAENLAALLMLVIMALPFIATVLAFAAFQVYQREALWACATFALSWTAILLIMVPLVRIVERMWLPFAAPLVIAALVGIVGIEVMGLGEGKPSLLPAVAAVLVAVPAWFLDRWQFERYEPTPSGDAGSDQVAAAHSGPVDWSSPMVRVLARAVWLQWQYAFLIVYVAGYGFVLTATKSHDLWTFYMLLYVGLGFFIRVFCSWTGQFLLLFVPRRTILRSVLGPIAAAPLLIGGVAAVAAASAQIIVWSLGTALVIVGVTWLWLPWAKEFGRPSTALLLSYLRVFPVTCCLVCEFVPGVKDFLPRPLSEIWPRITLFAASNPVLVSCVIVLAIGLLWWRCERKFRYFEPFDLPSGFTRTA